MRAKDYVGEIEADMGREEKLYKHEERRAVNVEWAT